MNDDQAFKDRFEQLQRDHDLPPILAFALLCAQIDEEKEDSVVTNPLIPKKKSRPRRG